MVVNKRALVQIPDVCVFFPVSSHSPHMLHRLIGLTRLSLNVTVFVWPCDGLVTCSGCGVASPKQYRLQQPCDPGRVLVDSEDGWTDGWIR